MNNIIIYLDMDGVLANFNKNIKGYLPELTKWERYQQFVKDLRFLDLEVNEGAYELFNLAKSIPNAKVKILSSMGARGKEMQSSVKAQKLQWLKMNHFDLPDEDIILVDISRSKGKYGKPFSILIDDRLFCCDCFMYNDENTKQSPTGGKAILHTGDYKQVIKELQMTVEKTQEALKAQLDQEKSIEELDFENDDFFKQFDNKTVEGGIDAELHDEGCAGGACKI